MKLGRQHNYHKGQEESMLPNVPYDLCVGVPISHLLNFTKSFVEL